jgi:formate dehydrogenase major subunit
VQALLGNIGRPGGGILALRGHTSIQGSTDIPTLYNLLPGYLPQPHAGKRHGSFCNYVKYETVPTGWMANFPRYAVSLLRAWYGDAANRRNGWGFSWVPKITGDHSQQPMMLAIRDGTIRGLLVMGQNPVVGGHNTSLIRKALPNLEWMAVRETFENETASSWYKSPEVLSGELRPQDIKTEIFLLPAALPGEKEGTFTNTHGLLQWHDKVVDPPGDCRSDLWFMYHLGRRLKELYADSDDPKDKGLQALTWDYPTEGPHAEPSADAVLREINGYTWPDRQQIDDFKHLKDDGSTACGCWIYCGAYPATTTTRRARAARTARTGPGRIWAGASPGLPTAASSTAAPPPTPRASPGRSASATSGGTPRRESGSATTTRTSRPPRRPTTSRTGRRTRAAWTLSTASRRSS